MVGPASPPGLLVGAAGFEPTTLSSRTIRATKLRHAPTGCPLSQGLRMIAEALTRAARASGLFDVDRTGAPVRWLTDREHREGGQDERARHEPEHDRQADLVARDID